MNDRAETDPPDLEIGAYTRERVVVDFGHRTSETEWTRILDKFAVNLAPLWFDWIGWILAIGALQYLLKNAPSFVLKIGLSLMILVSSALLWQYTHAMCFRPVFTKIPFVRKFSAQTQYFVSLAISFLAALCAWYMARAIALVVAERG